MKGLAAMDADDIIIDPEFEALLPFTDSTEDALLEQAVVDAGGALDPLVLWGDSNVLIDGHRRLKICKKHGLPFTTSREPLASREEVTVWMLFKQLGRRNVRDHARPRLVRKLYDRIKDGRKKCDGNAADVIAETIGTTRRSVYRYLELQKTVERLIPGWQTQAERIGLSKNMAAALSQFSTEDQEMLLDECVGNRDSMNKADLTVRLRQALGVLPEFTRPLPYGVQLPEGVEVGEFHNSSFKPGYASKKELADKIVEARKSFAETKRLAEELTGKYYFDSGVMRQRMLTSLSRVQACLKFLQENAHKRPKR